MITSSANTLDQCLDASVGSQSQEHNLYRDIVVLGVSVAVKVKTYADVCSDVIYVALLVDLQPVEKPTGFHEFSNSNKL